MSDCTEAIRRYAAARHFSSSTTERWLRLPADARGDLLRIAERLRLGENHFRDILDGVEDIAAREGAAPGSVLRTDEIGSLFSRKSGRNETLKALKRVLRRRRYPSLVRAEARLAELEKSIALPRGARMRFADELASPTVTVTIEASGSGPLRSLAQAVAVALQRPELDEMFAILEGNLDARPS